ncbi:MAG: hypothetical protein ACO1N3_04050 [Gammaproteobacteria bacterium]
MRNKTPPEQVIKFFKENPEAVKYSRAESGLSHSYVRNKSGKLTRIENNQIEDHVRGAGAFGRVI